MQDFARKGKRTRPRRIDTSVGIVRVQLANVGCRACGRVFAPLLLMLDLSGRRRTDRLARGPGRAGQPDVVRPRRRGRRRVRGARPRRGGRITAVADIAPRLDGVGRPDLGAPAGPRW